MLGVFKIMESKQYKIKNVKEMVDCTNEANLDNFLKDLKGYLSTAHMLRELADLVGDPNAQKIGEDGFTWIDDGKNEATITIGVKE